MKKVTFTSIIFLLIAHFAKAQQSQTDDEPFYYQIAGLVYVSSYDILNKTQGTDVRIPKEPLKFKIVSQKKDDKNNDFYVIQFPTITNDNTSIGGKTVSLTGDKTYINANDNANYF